MRKITENMQLILELRADNNPIGSLEIAKLTMQEVEELCMSIMHTNCHLMTLIIDNTELYIKQMFIELLDLNKILYFCGNKEDYLEFKFIGESPSE